MFTLHQDSNVVALLPPLYLRQPDLSPEPSGSRYPDGYSSNPALWPSAEQLNAISFSVLFQRYAAKALSVAIRILRDRAEAEEVVQDVFLYVFQNIPAFDPSRGTARNWILRIAVSRSIDRRLYLARHGFYAQTTFGTLSESVSSRGDLESETQNRLHRPLLEQALQALTPIQRDTIRHFFFEDMDLREISHLVGQPLGNVRHHLYRGLAHLRKNALIGKLKK